MDIARKLFDFSYDIAKPLIFGFTRKDPEIAHEAFIKFSQKVHEWGLEELLLDFSRDRSYQGFLISNAAGFNKNADIPFSFLHYLGFNRVVIGTVGADPWKGNDRPRMMRYPETESLVNWMGLP